MRLLRRWVWMFAVVLLLAVPAAATEYVALTFDDGPSGKYTQALLEGLEERGVRATFFLCGYRLEQYGPVAEQIRQGGHEIGLHGYSHKDMTTLSPGALEKELQDTLALLPEGGVVNLLRPPGGVKNPAVTQAARQQHLALVLWSVDPRDWDTGDAALVKQRVMEAKDGDVVLLHDLSDSSVAGALGAVDEMQARGVKFLTVSQLALLRLEHLASGGVYRGFALG